MNQLAMWASMFKLWNQENPEFTYSTSAMSSYYGSKSEHKKPADKRHCAHSYARKHVGEALKTPEEKEAHRQWCDNGKLSMKLHFPHVLVHANMNEGGEDGVAYRADMDRTKEPFVCHNTLDRHKF